MNVRELTHLQRAALFAEFSALAYEPSLCGSIHDFQVEPFRYEVGPKDTRLGMSGFVGHTLADVVVVFCGSKTPSQSKMDMLANWTINLAAAQVPGYGGHVHRGFAIAIAETWQEILNRVRLRRVHDAQRLWLTGHSLGGALATLAACRCADAGQTVAMVYTFGSPRVGDRVFAGSYALDHQRFENRNDVVAYLCPPSDDFPPALRSFAKQVVAQVFQRWQWQLPDSIFNYHHVSQCQFLDWDGALRTEPAGWLERVRHLGEALSDHGIGNYVQALRALSANG
jgi:pimeloyl-ACP methyl ester carboxylesterase